MEDRASLARVSQQTGILLPQPNRVYPLLYYIRRAAHESYLGVHTSTWLGYGVLP